MRNHFRDIPAARTNSRRINRNARIIIAVNLTTLDILQPSVFRNCGNTSSFRGVGVKHGDEDAS